MRVSVSELTYAAVRISAGLGSALDHNPQRSHAELRVLLDLTLEPRPVLAVARRVPFLTSSAHPAPGRVMTHERLHHARVVIALVRVTIHIGRHAGQQQLRQADLVDDRPSAASRRSSRWRGLERQGSDTCPRASKGLDARVAAIPCASPARRRGHQSRSQKSTQASCSSALTRPERVESHHRRRRVQSVFAAFARQPRSTASRSVLQACRCVATPIAPSTFPTCCSLDRRRLRSRGHGT